MGDHAWECRLPGREVSWESLTTERRVWSSVALEFGFVDLIERELLGDRATGEAGQVCGAADVAARPLERPAEIAFLESGCELDELFGEGPGEVDGELVARPARLQDLGGKVFRFNDVVARSPPQARSMAFSSSRMFPGHRCCNSASIASGAICFGAAPARLNF